MRFPNALDGVRKIYKAEIIALLSAVLAAVAALLLLIGAGSALASAAGGAVTGLVGGGVLMIAVAVLAIIAFIMNIVGLNKAKPDEDNFKYALYAVIIGIIASLMLGFAKSGSFLSGLGDTLNQICNFLCTWYVCTAIINLAKSLQDAGMEQKGVNARRLLLTAWCFTIVLNVLGTILKNSSSIAIGVVSGIILLAAAVVRIIAYILYLKLLSNARTMLEA